MLSLDRARNCMRIPHPARLDVYTRFPPHVKTSDQRLNYVVQCAYGESVDRLLTDAQLLQVGRLTANQRHDLSRQIANALAAAAAAPAQAAPADSEAPGFGLGHF